jgi:hypothetical protein
MEALLTAIITWLSVNFGLPPDYELPTVARLSNAELVEIRYGDIEPSKQREVVAVYDDATETILLSDTWTGRTPADQSVIVHEMVHHLQKRAHLRFECETAREQKAYAAQEAWLQLFGRSLETEFNIDRMTLKLATSCMPF